MPLTSSPAFRGPQWLGMPATLQTVVLRLRDRYRRHRARRDDRDAFMHLLRLDDRVLDDIGVTREEVEWAAALPLEVNAAAALWQRAGARRGCTAGN